MTRLARRAFSLACIASSLMLSACFGGGASPSPTAQVPSTPATAASPAASPAAQPSPSPAAQPTAAAEARPDSVWVGNTDGEGVFIRQSPAMADRVRAYADGTQLQLIGDDVFGDGQRWHHVRAPDGLEGFVPVIYTVDAPP
jgi:hypothetical protein